MITDAEVLRLFERAKPASVDDATTALDAAGYLDALVARGDEWTCLEDEPAREPVGAAAWVVDLEAARGERTGRRRWLIAAAAAVAAVVLVGATVLVRETGSRRGRTIAPAGQAPDVPSNPAPVPPSQVPPAPVERVGFLGLPPDGAAPNTPEAQLVASWYAAPHLAFPSGGWYGVSYLYADGRLVSMRVQGPVTSTDPSKASGWFVQRLTPAGVDLVHAEILSTGLFGAGVPATHDTFGSIEVRNGDSLVNVSVDWPGSSDSIDLLRHLGDLQSWLPDRAWDSREMTAWVPSRYVVSLAGHGANDLVALANPSSVLALLPSSAQELLASTTPRADDGCTCFEMTTQQARQLAAVLDAAGFEGDSGSLFRHYSFDARQSVSPEAISTTVHILFGPRQPDGAPSALGGL